MSGTSWVGGSGHIYEGDEIGTHSGDCPTCEQEKEADDKILARVLRNFIDRNLDDHGYVGLRPGEVILDGRVPVSAEETAALRRTGLLYNE